jgi:branched-chain amino acid transport system substrate-binding protein
MTGLFRFLGIVLLVSTTAVFAQQPVKIGFVTFLSGPAAAPFGLPAKNAVDLVVADLNAGKVPAPYNKKGFGGSTIESVIIDEAGSTTTQVTEFRNLVQRHNVDLVIGYVSSGNCLAVAPVAEELKKLTTFFDCGTPRIFEDNDYQYVYRTSSHATMDNVAAALYVKDVKPNVKSIAGINQNYAWGQDSWADFEASMKQLVPGLEVKTSQMPKLFAGQYNAEISALLGASPDVLHSSFFDGDLEALLLQGQPRELMKKSLTVLTPARPRCTSCRSKFPTARSSARADRSAPTRRTTPTTAGTRTATRRSTRRSRTTPPTRWCRRSSA